MSYVEYENLMYSYEEYIRDIQEYEDFQEDMRNMIPNPPTDEEMEHMAALS